MAWVLVIIAGILETGFALLLKASHGFSRLWPTIGFAACAISSFGLLTLSLKTLDVGPAYAVWTGIGAAGTALMGIWLYDESSSVLKLVSIALILAGVVGLNLSGISH
ncbi:DMT family transporter [Yinghuangia seranimata]|uniref:DMT family transporter n=1 Tax=Yinghuangia seranimata TaxID=408067 RepID=UPI00248C1086|nr:multidrug efflux SMR transporter [Yinghuangia seranimata]MDI2131751.1 multidrug efflux SMR transporter [Yinghuangia seranimata]